MDNTDSGKRGERVGTRTDSIYLANRERLVWRAVQGLLWLVGVAIFFLLIFKPEVGLNAFWNVLIPVAPALVVFAPGLWRNVCPLASTALFPRHMNWSLRRRLPDRWRHFFNFLAVLILFAIVPLRHVLLDTSGLATAIVIAALAVLAVVLGFVFEWKSGWCSGLCPINPVEKLYGTKPALAFKNAHCHSCENCVSVCPDSVPGRHLAGRKPPVPQHIAEYLMVGGFPGFVLGWSLVPDYAPGEGWAHMGQAYGMPLGGLLVSMVLYSILKALCGSDPKLKRILADFFAASAVTCYYWFRLPAVFGLEPNSGDGMLVDLRGILPDFTLIAFRIATTSLFFWWLVIRKAGLAKWSIRPPVGNAIASSFRSSLTAPSKHIDLPEETAS